MPARRLLILFAAATALSLTASVSGPGGTAQAARNPFSNFGFAFGNLDQMSAAQRSSYLDAIRVMAGPNGSVRTDIRWNPNTRSGPDFALYDGLATAIAAAGVRWLPVIHLGGGGTYYVPARSADGTMASWRANLKAIADRYGPGGSFTAPGWQPITRYEIWNEPNDATGNAGGALTAQDVIQLLKDGAAGIRDAAAAHGWNATIVGPALGKIDFSYLNTMYGIDPSFLNVLDGVSVHVFMKDDPALPGGTTQIQRIRTLATLRAWLDDHGAPDTSIWMTEGGYSGADGVVPPNVVSEARQADWGRGALRWIHANPDLEVDYFGHYNPIDANQTTYTGNGTQFDYSFWLENLGAASPGGTSLKPWGVAYRDDIAAMQAAPTPATIAPTSLTFGDQAVGTTSDPQQVTISNRGSGVTRVSDVTLTGTDAAQFTLAPVGAGCPIELYPGESCAMSVTYTPSSAGTAGATVSITATGGSFAVTLAGSTPAGASKATVSPGSIDFGSQPVGSASAARDVTVASSGSSPLVISKVAASGDFAVTAETCTAAAVAPGDHCTISVSFTPGAAGQASGSLTVTDDAADSPQSVALAGTGTVGAPAAAVTPSAIDFGSQPVGGAAASRTVTLTSSGNAPLHISSIATAGSPAFSQTNDCAATLAAADSCHITVSFNPAAAGSFNGSLAIADDAADSPQTVSLTGSGAAAPAIGIAPTALAFGNQAVDTTSAAKTVTITSSGNADLHISALSISGSSAFAVAGQSCTANPLAPGTSCTVSVTFTPAAAAGYSGSLVIGDDAAGAPHSVSLTGTGTAPAASVTPTSISFGTQAVGTTSASRTVTVTSTGSAPLTMSTVSLAGAQAAAFRIVTNGCAGKVLAPGASCTVDVAFAPSASGSAAATLQISDDAPNKPQLVSLSGTGGSVAATVSPTSLSWTQRLQATPNVKSVTLKSTGTAALQISSLALGGTNPAVFSIRSTSTCTAGKTLAPGASCRVDLTFVPTAKGTFTATLSIVTNAAQPSTVKLTGKAT